MLFYEDDPVYFYLEGVKTPGLITDVSCDQESYEAGEEEEQNVYHVTFRSNHKNKINTRLFSHRDLILASEHMLTEQLKVGDKAALLDTFIFKMRPGFFNLEEVAGRIVTIIDADSPCDEDSRITFYKANLQGTIIIMADYDINIAKTLQINSARLEMRSVQRPELPQI